MDEQKIEKKVPFVLIGVDQRKFDSGRTGSSVSVPINNSLFKAQKTKKLINIYEKLSCEGFVDDQIELALSSLRVETNKVYLRDTTIVSPFSILLFGSSISLHHQNGSVTIDGWLKVAAPAQTAVLFKELRLTLHSILKDLRETRGIVHNEVVKSMVLLLIKEGKPQHI